MDRTGGIPKVHATVASEFAHGVDNDVEEALSTVIDLVSDGVEGLTKCAELVEDTVAQSLFRLWANERRSFLADLHNIAARFSGNDGDPGTTRATLHRTWMTVKNMVTGDDESVFESASRGERAAIDAYEDALATDLPDDVRPILQNQLDEIRSIHDRLTKGVS